MPSNKDAVTDVTMTISRKNSSLNLIYKAIRERKKIQKKNHKTKHHSIDTPKNEEKKKSHNNAARGPPSHKYLDIYCVATKGWRSVTIATIW